MMHVCCAFFSVSVDEGKRAETSLKLLVLCNGCNEFVASENLAENKAAGVAHDALICRVNSKVNVLLIKLCKQTFLVTHK